MAFESDGFGGNTTMRLFMNPETGASTWLTPYEAEVEERAIEAEKTALAKTQGEEFERRQEALRERVKKMTPASLFETPDGDVTIPTADVPAFLKQAKAQGIQPKAVRGYQAKGFIGADGKKYDAPRFFAGTEDDPALKQILLFQQENSPGYLTPNIMHYMGLDTEESFARNEEHNAKRVENLEAKLKEQGAMGAVEATGKAVGFGGVSLAEQNKGKSVPAKILNYLSARWNPVASGIDEYAQAVEARLGSDEGFDELKRREKAGEPLLTKSEKFRLGLWGETDALNTAESVHSYLNERRANRGRAEYEESVRGTTFTADVLRATEDSGRMGMEFALLNTLLPGSGAASVGGKLATGIGKKLLRGAVGTGVEAVLHGEANRQKLRADQVRFDPTTGGLTVTDKGAGELEALLKGYGAGGLEYVSEMYTESLLWKPLGKLAKKGLARFMPNVAKKWTERVARKYAGSQVATWIDHLAANPTMDALRRVSERTGVDLSWKGMINEAIGEELPANVISALFNLEDVGGMGTWEDAWNAGLETFKNAPAMMASVAVMGSGTGVAVRSAQGVYNFATDRRTMTDALEAFGHKREDLKGKSKAELNDLFFAEMHERGKTYASESEIAQMSEEELDKALQEIGAFMPADKGEGIPIEQKRDAYKRALEALGGNVFSAKAANAVGRAAARTLLSGLDYGNAAERLEADIFKANPTAFDAETREQMRKYMTVRSMSGSDHYRGTLAGEYLDAVAEGVWEDLPSEAQGALTAFEQQYAPSETAFPGTAGAQNATYEASTFRKPMLQSDWGNNPQGGYLDMGTDISVRPFETDENGRTVSYRVDANGTTVRNKEALTPVERELADLGLGWRVGLPLGIQSTFRSQKEAFDFADKLSAWQNTEKRRLLEKAKAAQLMYGRIRKDAEGGLALFRRPQDVPEAVRDEMMAALQANTWKRGQDAPALMARFSAIKGFTSSQDGKVYLFLDNQESPYSMLNTIQHEGLHQGLLDTFRGDKEKLNATLAELAKGENLPEWLKREVAKAKDDPRYFEELLAQVAESVNRERGLFRRVSNALRRASARVDGVAMTEGDVHALIFEAFKARRWDGRKTADRRTGLYSEVAGSVPQTVTAKMPQTEKNPAFSVDTTPTEGNVKASVKEEAQAETQVEAPAQAEAEPGTEPELTFDERARNVAQRQNLRDIIDEEEPTEAEPAQQEPARGVAEFADNPSVQAMSARGDVKPGTQSVAEMILDRGARVERVPVAALRVNERIAQFKRGADPKTGVVPGSRLSGQYAPTIGRPIRVMQFKDGHLEVITGRHRLDLAKQNRMEEIPAIVYREADGMTVEKARALDSAENVMDGKGSTQDYIRFFRDTALSQEELAALGLTKSESPRVRDAYALATNAIEDVQAFALDANMGGLSISTLGAIAQCKPAVQRALLDAALKKGVRDPTAIQMMGNALANGFREESGEQVDLFDADDAVLEESRLLGLGQAAFARELQNDRAAISGVMHHDKTATIRREAAKRLGITDPNSRGQLQRAYDRLGEEIEAWMSPTISGEKREQALARGREIDRKRGAKQESLDFSQQKESATEKVESEKSTQTPEGVERREGAGRDAKEDLPLEEAFGKGRVINTQALEDPETLDAVAGIFERAEDRGNKKPNKTALKKRAPMEPEREAEEPVETSPEVQEKSALSAEDRKDLDALFAGLLREGTKKHSDWQIRGRNLYHTDASPELNPGTTPSTIRNAGRIVANQIKDVQGKIQILEKILATGRVPALDERRAVALTPGNVIASVASNIGLARGSATSWYGDFSPLESTKETVSLRMSDHPVNVRRVELAGNEKTFSLIVQPRYAVTLPLPATRSVIKEYRYDRRAMDAARIRAFVEDVAELLRTGEFPNTSAGETIAPVGMAREGTPKVATLSTEQKELFIRRLPTTMANMAVRMAPSERTLKAFAEQLFAYLSEQGHLDMWEAVKPLLRGGWTQLCDIHEDWRLEEVSRADVAQIFRALEGTQVAKKRESPNGKVREIFSQWARANGVSYSEHDWSDGAKVPLPTEKTADGKRTFFREGKTEGLTGEQSVVERVGAVIGNDKVYFHIQRKTPRVQRGTRYEEKSEHFFTVPRNSPLFSNLYAFNASTEPFMGQGFGSVHTPMDRALRDVFSEVYRALKHSLPIRSTSGAKPLTEKATAPLDENSEPRLGEAKDVRATRGIIEESNGKERQDGRSGNLEDDGAGHPQVGGESEERGSVQPETGAEPGVRAEGSVGSRVDGDGVRPDGGRAQPSEDALSRQSVAPTQTALDDAGGRTVANLGSGRKSGGATAPVPEVGSSASVLPERASSQATLSENGGGESGTQEPAQGSTLGRRSLLKTTNYRIPEDGGQIGKVRGERARFRANADALAILKKLSEENRPATAQEQTTLALYSGWGGLSTVFDESNEAFADARDELKRLLTPREFELARRSVQYAHYTPIAVVQAMYDALEKLGVVKHGAGARMFEAGTGVGNFIGTRPGALFNAPYTGVEVDPVSARIAQALYPKASIQTTGFQDYVLPEGTLDVVIGNPPFSDLKLTDKTFPESRGMSMHNHFIAKQIRGLRPGGIGAFIVSRYFMDAQDARTREYIFEQADLLGAVRLPGGTFKASAGTDVITDIVLFRKRMPGEVKPPRDSEKGQWVDTTLFPQLPKTKSGKTEAAYKDQIVTPMNRYFAEGAHEFSNGTRAYFAPHVLGTVSVQTDSRWKRPTLLVSSSYDGASKDFDTKVRHEIGLAFESQLPEGIYKPAKRKSPQKEKQEEEGAKLASGERAPDGIMHPALMMGGHFVDAKGNLYWLKPGKNGEQAPVKVETYNEKAELKAWEEKQTEGKDVSKRSPFNRWRDVPDASAKLTPKEQALAKALLHLRNVRYDLVALERSPNATDEQVAEKRAELNEAYEAVKPALNALEKLKGLYSINVPTVRHVMGADPAMGNVLGLEEFRREKRTDAEGNEIKNGRYTFTMVKKAAIFERRVYNPERAIQTHFDTVQDAYAANINHSGRIDLDWLSSVLGRDIGEVEEMLSKSGLAYFDPSTQAFQPREAYLSGDVKTKLVQAEELLKQGDRRMTANVEALKAVQPEYLPFNKISVSFGAPFIPSEYIGQFAMERLGFRHRDTLKAIYYPEVASWTVDIARWDVPESFYETFPCPGSVGISKIFSAALDNKTISITPRDDNDRPEAARLTQMANKTVGQIRTLWESWWMEDPARAKHIADIYNDKFVRFADAKYDGSLLTFDGKDPAFVPYKHQRDAAWRAILTRNVLFNHVVGSGKTGTTILAIMEMRRMGLMNKPAIIVPNSLTQQWRSEFLKIYPGANVLAPQIEEFKEEERKRLMARIQNGNWDVVVIPHSQFARIALQPEVQRQFIEEEIEQLRQTLATLRADPHKKSPSLFRIEHRIQSLEEKLGRNIDKIKKDDTGLFFDTLGIDGIFVDEAHEFKNVPYVTSEQVAGLGNASGSAKALDLLMKIRWLRRALPEAPVAFLTGTPVSNSLVELYLNLRYMAPDELQKANITSADAFFANFCEITTEFEIQPSGAYKEKKRLRNLKNAGSLMQMIRSYMDVIDADDLKASMRAVGREPDIPELEGGGAINVVAKRSPEQRRYFGVPTDHYQMPDGRCETHYPEGSILYRAEHIDPRNLAKDNMLKVVGDATKASLDMRLIDPTFPDFAGSKVNLCVERLLQNYREYDSVKGTQIVFCDLGIPAGGKTKLKNEMKALREKLAKAEATYRKAIATGKTDEEIAESVDEEGQSLIDRIASYKRQLEEGESVLECSFSIYDDIKQKLIAQGVPAREIAFIHDFENDAQKFALFERVNKGAVRVLIGSTSKMGTGVNVQQRVVAIHHLDAPWRPADLAQRNGRVIRQGNMLRKLNPEFRVRDYQYATERTSDAFRWQVQEAKAKAFGMIYKIRPDESTIEDISEDSVSAGDMKAASVGSKINPRKAVVGKLSRQLNEERSAKIQQRAAMEDNVENTKANITIEHDKLKRAEQVLRLAKPLERPGGNVYYGVELEEQNGKRKGFPAYKTTPERMKNEGKSYESLAWQMQEGKLLHYRGIVWGLRLVDGVLGTYPIVSGYATVEDAKRHKNALLALDRGSTIMRDEEDGTLLGRINKALNKVDESTVEAHRRELQTLEETLKRTAEALDGMPKSFPKTPEAEALDAENADLDYVMRLNCLTGQEAHYALSVKYGKENVPNYDWADPSDFGEADAPTPLREDMNTAKTNATPGNLREAAMAGTGFYGNNETPSEVARRIAKAGRVTFKSIASRPGAVNDTLATWSQLQDHSGKRAVARAIYNSLMESGQTAISMPDGTVLTLTLNGIENVFSHMNAKNTALARARADFLLNLPEFAREAVKFYEETKNGKRYINYTTKVSYNGQPWHAMATAIHDPETGMNVLNDVNALSAIEKRRHPDGGHQDASSPVGRSQRAGSALNSDYSTGHEGTQAPIPLTTKSVLKEILRTQEGEFGNLREGGAEDASDLGRLNAHLQRRREALPKSGIAKAREKVQQALKREEGETRTAWRKRKANAIASFVSEKMIDARQPIIDAVKEIAGDVKLAENEDIALAMQTSYGRVFSEHLDIDQKYVTPVLKLLADNALSVEELDTYLLAQFAPERNRMIAERTQNKRNPDGNLSGAGITDAEAASLLRGLQEKLSPEQFHALGEASKKVYAMNRENLARLVAYGVMAKEQALVWLKLSPHYVPLRDDYEKLGIEMPGGNAIAGNAYKRAVGRFSEANTSHFAWSILQAKQGVMWAEQNYINNMALNFCLAHKSDGDYRVSAVPASAKRVFKQRKGFKMSDAKPLRKSVDAEREAIEKFQAGGFTIVQDPKNPDIFWVDAHEIDTVLRVRSAVDKIRTAQEQNVIAKVGGERVYILFNPSSSTRGNRMGRAINRANMVRPDNFLWNIYEKLTRVKSVMTTTLSLTFAIRNMVSDFLGSTSLMLAEGKGEALREMYKLYAPALKEVYTWKRKGAFTNSELGDYCKEAVKNGILTGTWANATHDSTLTNAILEPLILMKERQNFGKEIGATLDVAYRTAKDFLYTTAEIPEVGVRLAVYAALRKNGMSANDATVYAREITIDFNKKGAWSPVTNVLYMFSNANIQALYRWKSALFKDGKFNTKAAVLCATTYFLVGLFNKMLMNALFGGDDDDDTYQNIPNHAYERGIPIMLGKYYIDIPTRGLPNIFMYLGSRMYDVFADPNTTVAEALVDTAKGPVLDSANFVNGSGSLWQYLAPTLLDPLVQIAENKQWTGLPLHAPDYGGTTPKAYLGRKYTSEWSKAAAKTLNVLTGGDDVEAGFVDVYPETIALIGQFFVSQLGMDIAGLGQLATGDLDVRNVPALRGVLKRVPDNSSRYFEAAATFNRSYSQFQEYAKEGRTQEASAFVDKNPFLRQAWQLEALSKRIRKITTEKNRNVAKGLETDYLDKQLDTLRGRFLEVYRGGKISK